MALTLGLAVAFPFYWMFVNAVQGRDQRFVYPPQELPRRFTLAGFRGAIDSNLLLWLRNSLLVSLGASLLALVIGSFGAYAMSRFRSQTMSGVAFLVVMTQMVPPIVLMIPLFRIYVSLDLFDTFRGVVLANFVFVLPVTMWMLKTIMDGVPRDLDAAAMIDGANHLQILARIVAPLILPGYVAAGIFAFITSWDEFLFSRLLIRDPDNWVGTIGIASFFGFQDNKFDEVWASAVLFTLPPLVLFLAVQRFFIKGLVGGIKG